jgi:hypothetical protein
MLGRHLVAGLCFVGALTASGQNKFGRFEGDVVTKWVDDRRMTLVKPFAYIAADGTRWEAPEGATIDGASIPQFAWSIIGGPFEGNYRFASVVHDVACEVRTRPWQAVHQAFYTAMLAANVSPAKAKVMYAAVYYFGPRWPRTVRMDNVPLWSAQSEAAAFSSRIAQDEKAIVKILPIEKQATKCLACAVEPPPPPPDHANVIITLLPDSPALSQEEFKDLQAAIQAKDLSLEEIRRYHPMKKSQ